MGFGKSALAAVAFSLCGVLPCSHAAAQNSLAATTNVRTSTIYDGVTIAQAKAIFATTKFNGENFTVMERQAEGGYDYLVVTSPSLPFAFFLAGIDDGYSGAGDGVFAGLGIVMPVNLAGFAQADIHAFNLRQKFVKLSTSDGQSFYSVELLAAGGVTGETMTAALVPFFGSLPELLNLATTQTVNYAPGTNVPSLIASPGEYNVVFSNPAFQDTKRLAVDLNAMGSERMIESLIDRLARR